jgi:hypothetical protein
VTYELHPPGRRRLRSAVRDDGYETWTIAEVQLAGHPSFPSGRFTNWIRFVKVDLECEGVVERTGPKSPQRVRIAGGF